MATRTTSQAGDWTDTATWGGSAAPTSADDAVVNHAVAVDANSACAALAVNAALTVDSGFTLTVHGNVTKANVDFTLSAGAGLVFDCTSADRKFLFGDAANFTSYSSYFKTLGTSGSRCSVSKTGSNYCWFDDFSENSGAGSNKTGYDCAYTDFSGIGKSDGSFSLALDDFGALHQRLDHCTFDGCAEVWRPRPYLWDGGTNRDCYARDCLFENSTGTYPLYVRGTTSGTGVRDITRCAFDKSPNYNSNCALTDCLFERGLFFAGGTPASTAGCLFRVGNGDSDQSMPGDTDGCYWLGGLDHPGNPHCLNGLTASSTHEGWVGELPAGNNALDSGELFYDDVGGVTVTGCLLVPSEADGEALGNVAHNFSSGGVTAWVVTHNTVVGGNNAYVAYTELASDGSALYSSVKSNLAVDPSGSTAAVCFDVEEAYTDMVTTANVSKNGKFGQVAYFDSTSGATLQGYRSHFTTAPGGDDVTGDPRFVDDTRNFANWAVYKGAASGGDSLAVRTAASLALLRADPTLIADDLIPWVRGGFAPTNAIYQNAGHDSVTIGAVEFVSGSILPLVACDMANIGDMAGMRG
jgi:hypothetical protein